MQVEIIVAIITAVAGWLALILTKEQKVSEFRQKWVDELRKDLSLLVATVEVFIRAYKNSTNRVSNYRIDNDKQEILSHTIQRIKYRLNPDDAEGLIEVVDELSSELMSGHISHDSIANLEYLLEQANEIGHVILKTEWERVKKGELWFYWSKWGFLFLAISIFIRFILNI